MSYRLVKLATFYPAYLADYSRRQIPRIGETFDSASELLFTDAFGWANFYARNLKSLGVEAQELVVNVPWLQEAWAREHNCTKTGDALVLEQLSALRPDVLFIQDISRFSADFIAEARRRTPSIRSVLAWCCAPYGDSQVATLRACDAVLSCTKGFVDDLTALGHRAFLLNHAFEATLLGTLPGPTPVTMDVSFAGHVVNGTGWHETRAHLLQHLIVGGVNLHVFGRLVDDSPCRSHLKQAAWFSSRLLDSVGFGRIADQVPSLAKARHWSRRPSRFAPALRAAVKAPVFGVEMYNVLRSSRVSLNNHIDITPRYAGNMRLFECTGVGTCLLTDWKENLGELFEIDNEVVAYRSAEECSEKLAWLLANDEGRNAIAMRGQRRTLKSHTFALRAAQLDELIRNQLTGK